MPSPLVHVAVVLWFILRWFIPWWFMSRWFMLWWVNVTTLYADCTSPRPSLRETNPLLTPYSDLTSYSSDFDSEPDQVSTHPEQPPRKKRQRTTFSRNEVLELEQAFRRRPYLIGDDDEKLGQRLGIPAKSVKVS